MDNLSSDLLLHIFSYLSVKDADRSMCCKRFVYLLDEFRLLMEPHLVACSNETLEEMCDGEELSSEYFNNVSDVRHHHCSASHTRRKWKRVMKKKKKTFEDVVKGAISKLRSRPNVAFLFYDEDLDYSDWRSDIDKLLPPETAVIGALSESNIQTNCAGIVESDSGFSCMIGSFPRAQFVSFGFDVNDENVHDEFQRYLKEAQKPTSNCMGTRDDPYWKVFVVYVMGYGYEMASEFIETLELEHKNSLIVGGVCGAGDVRMTPSLYNDQKASQESLENKTTRQLGKFITSALGSQSIMGLSSKKEYLAKAKEVWMMKKASAGRRDGKAVTHVSDGICILAIGGDIPGRSIVSRGVKSNISGIRGVTPDNPWRIEETERKLLGRSTTTSDDCREVIKLVKNVSTGKTVAALDFLYNYGTIEYTGYIGIERCGGDGYELEHPEIDIHGLHIPSNGKEETSASLKGAKIDLFQLDGQACDEDLDRSLSLLKVQLENEKLVGAIMFSCSGRGPTPGLLADKMADATKFSCYFPMVPCVGIYANGEIGPQVSVGKRDVFRTGKAACQGFTAVFLVFVVPRNETERYMLDDSSENIMKHMEGRAKMRICCS